MATYWLPVQEQEPLRQWCDEGMGEEVKWMRGIAQIESLLTITGRQNRAVRCDESCQILLRCQFPGSTFIKSSLMICNTCVQDLSLLPLIPSIKFAKSSNNLLALSYPGS